MSLHAMMWARQVKAPLTSNEVHVLLELADFADDDGRNCRPKMSTLARRCRLSRSTVYRILERLEHVHHVIRKERSGQSAGSANHYRLLVDEQPSYPPEIVEGSPLDAHIAPIPNLLDPEGVCHGDTPLYPQVSRQVTHLGVAPVTHLGVATRDTCVAPDDTRGVAPDDTPHTPQYPSGSPTHARGDLDADRGGCHGGHLDRYGDPVACGVNVPGCSAFKIDEDTKLRGLVHIEELRAKLRSGTADAAKERAR